MGGRVFFYGKGGAGRTLGGVQLVRKAGGEAGYYVYAGVRSDPAVARIELRREDGAPLIAEEFPADTFCFSWQEGAGNMKSVTVYDCSGNVLAVYGAGMERCDS